MKNFKNIIFSAFISALLILSISQPSANALSSWGYELSSGSSLSSWGSSHRIFDTKKPSPPKPAPPAPSPSPELPPKPAVPVTNQGDKIGIKDEATGSLWICTLGFVDKAQSKGYVAAHCLAAAQKPVFYTSDFSRRLGVGYNDQEDPSENVYTFGDNNYREDRAYFIFDDKENIGSNIYSGDRVLAASEIQSGERACFYGATSQKIKCGSVVNTNNTAVQIKLDNGEAMIPGDSGGPMWIVGRGFAGVNSIALGTWVYDYQQGVWNPGANHAISVDLVTPIDWVRKPADTQQYYPGDGLQEEQRPLRIRTGQTGYVANSIEGQMAVQGTPVLDNNAVKVLPDTSDEQQAQRIINVPAPTPLHVQ